MINHKQPPRTARTASPVLLTWSRFTKPLKNCTRQAFVGLPATVDDDQWLDGVVQLQVRTVQVGVHPVLKAGATDGPLFS